MRVSPATLAARYWSSSVKHLNTPSTQTSPKVLSASDAKRSTVIFIPLLPTGVSRTAVEAAVVALDAVPKRYKALRDYVDQPRVIGSSLCGFLDSLGQFLIRRPHVGVDLEN